MLVKQDEVVEYPINGMIADTDPSSRIDMLAGLSRCWTRRTPPGFWASAVVAIVMPNRNPAIVARARGAVIYDPPDGTPRG